MTSGAMLQMAFLASMILFATMAVAAPVAPHKLFPLENDSGSFTKRGLSEKGKIALIIVFVGPIALSVAVVIMSLLFACVAALCEGCSSCTRKKGAPKQQKGAEDPRTTRQNAEPQGADLGAVDQFVGDVSS
ncbi:hypothetical protein M407DRAFT_19324 [Tulasnella calospora MUT 4182]|uniref:Uncharacterized protein n=1 Tax=Tulasnella calospora MUT 4182 TaxID=1051891 RepID=A0A0C3QIE8_9AGAM|nr:hypothetical protein M407DRAFT_19324 [Tulasnella calospora MUT 4182]